MRESASSAEPMAIVSAVVLLVPMLMVLPAVPVPRLMVLALLPVPRLRTPVVPESMVRAAVAPDLIVKAPAPVTVAPEAPRLMAVAAPPILSVVYGAARAELASDHPFAPGF